MCWSWRLGAAPQAVLRSTALLSPLSNSATSLTTPSRRRCSIGAPRGTVGNDRVRWPHGMGGSAGVGILLVASIESQLLGVISLGALAIFVASFAFAIWYGAAAWALAPNRSERSSCTAREALEPVRTRMTSPRLMRFVFVAHPAVKAR
jgi:hypothetical protein